MPEKMKRKSHMFRKTFDYAEFELEELRSRIDTLEIMVENTLRRNRGIPLGCINCHAHVDNVELSGLTRDEIANSLTYAYTCNVCGDVFRLELGLEGLIIYGNDFTRTIGRPIYG